MTFKELRETLKKNGIENADFEAGVLFSHFANIRAAQLPLNPSCDKEELKDALRRRIEKEPLQYILGECEFYSEKYFLSSECLIPRADTEIIVEYAIKNLPKGAFFADLCTGSGCIAISILANRKDCRALACDISEGALETAKRNAHRNNVADRIEFFTCDVLKDKIDGQFDAVISNPPYIRSDVIPTLSKEVQNEPIRALDGGEDGMIFYRRIVKDYKDSLKENGFLLFETGYDQKEEIIKVADENSLLSECLCDYGQNHRGAVMKRKTF